MSTHPVPRAAAADPVTEATASRGPRSQARHRRRAPGCGR
jgi:hypothetical protein